MRFHYPRLLLVGGCWLLNSGVAHAQVGAAVSAEVPRLDELAPALTSASYLAQGEPEAPGVPAAAPPAAPDGEELDEVTVYGSGGYRRKNASSGTKTDTPILLTPQSIQVIPRQVIEDQGAIRLDEVVRNVSGVAPSSAVGGRVENLTIRGFAANQFQNGFLDNFFASRAFRETVNIERVEVVKGPASVLYGRAEPSGIVNIATKRPRDKPYYAVDFTAGSYSLYRPTLDFSGPLTEDGNLGYRLNLAYEDAGSFRERVQTSRVFFSPVLQWKIGPETTLTFEGEHLRDSRPLDRGLVAIGTAVADLPIGRFLGNPENLSFFNQTRLYAILDHRFNRELALRTALRYTAASERNSAGQANPNRLLSDNRTLSLSSFQGDQYYETYFLQNDLTWKFNTGSVGHTALLGFEFGKLYSKFTFDRTDGGLLDIFNPVYPVTFLQRAVSLGGTTRIDNFGIYLQDQISLFESLQLVLAGRFDNFNSEDINLLSGERTPTYAEAFSPRVGLLYQPAPTVSLFANFGQSFVPVTGISAAGTPFLPQRGTGYEVGAKADLAGGRLFANLALYKIAKTNILTSDLLNPGFSVQIGEQQSQGIEFDISGEILPGWNVIATYAYTDARISKDNDLAVGNPLNTVPRNSGSLWMTYRLQEGALQGLGIGLGVFAVSDRPGDLDNTFTLPGYTRTDAALYYTRDNFKSAINFKNLFDIRYFDGSQGRAIVVPGPPFAVQGTIGLQF
ncbi:MAG: TonB-dependent siderophore receptor [Aphanocapsa lilacina HA4352-LM1]|jgi:iron complex outermembrane receptor protein|nr:TonB-dependent siderophore receptor [Aphanocapsa lilacina HA4352-LM1]